MPGRLDTPRLFRRGDPDFPTTPALQRHLVAARRVAGEGPNAATRRAPLTLAVILALGEPPVGGGLEASGGTTHRALPRCAPVASPHLARRSTS